MISAIIPTYNRASLLERCIDSVAAQTHRPTELLIIDDGSTDETAQLLSALADDLPYLRHIKQSNMGEAAARNRGLREAKYSIVAYLDSDDTWDKQHLENVIKCFDRIPNASATFAAYQVVDSAASLSQDDIRAKYLRRDCIKLAANRIFEHFYLLDNPQCLSLCLQGSLGFSSSTLALHRERLKRQYCFDESLAMLTDVDFRLQMLASGEGIAYIDCISSTYYFHGSNAVSTKIDPIQVRIVKVGYALRALSKMFAYCSHVDDFRAVCRQLSDTFYALGGLQIDANMHADAIQSFRSAFIFSRRWSIAKHLLLHKLAGIGLYSLIAKLSSCRNKKRDRHE